MYTVTKAFTADMEFCTKDLDSFGLLDKADVTIKKELGLAFTQGKHLYFIVHTAIE